MPSRARKAREQAKLQYADGALGSACLKTRLCTFYSKGGCPRDRFCKFAHGEEELQRAPDLSRTKMCPALLKSGVCKKGTSCRFAHSEDEVRPITDVMPEPVLAAALLTTWQQKSERWSELSTDASDGTLSEVSGLESCCRDMHALSDDDTDIFGETYLSTSSPSSSSRVFLVGDTFLDSIGQLKEGTHLFHGPTGMALTIRNTFFDVDDRPRRCGSERRCSSAHASLGASAALIK